MADTIITVGGDLTQLERQIQAVLSRNFRLSGLDSRGFTQPLGKIKGQLGEFEKSLEASNARVVAFGASAGAIYLLGDAFKGLIRSTIEVEKSLADINTVLGESSSNIKKFGNEIFNIANDTSQSFETAAQAALEFSRQGLGLEETLKRTSAALTLAKISGLSAADSVEALTSTVNSFNDAALTDIQIVNKLAAVDARYAVSSADLAEAIKRVGSSASEAGISLDQLIALVTSAQQTTARGGAVIGNSFKTIFTRIQRPKVLESLEEIGVITKSVTGETLPLIQVLNQLANTYDNLGAAQKSQVAELVGGVYQINILKAVIGDLSKEFGSTYTGALKASSSATNEAERRVASLTQTLDSQINRITNNLQRAGSVIGDLTIAPALEKVLSAANGVLETFALGKEPESYGEKAAVGFLKGLGSFISGPGLLLGAAAAFQIFKRLASFVSDAGKTVLGLGQASQRQAEIQAQILQLLQRNPALYSQIQSGAISVQDAAQGYLNIVNLTNAALERQKALAGQIAQVAFSGGTGPITGATRGSRRRASSGFIPNFADEGQMMESIGAANHKNGYKAGQAYQTTIHDGKGNSFKSWVNSAEKVKTFTNASGYKATIVRPPNGFGPGTQMAARGFIPNFAKKQGLKKVDLGAKGKEFEKLINYYLTNEATSAGTALLDFPYPSNSLTNASAQNKAKISLNSASIFGDAKIKSASYSRKDLIKKLVGSLDANSYKNLIKQAENSTGDFINLNRFLPAKPSLISSKNIITPDQLNATASAELGGDVVLNLARLYKNPVTDTLTENGFHKRLLLNYIEDYVTIPNFSSGFIPNFAAGDGSLSLSEYAANKGKSIKQLVPASLNAAYSKGVSAQEINKYFPAWQYKGATIQEAARRSGASQAQQQKLKEEFAFNKKLIKEIIIPWNKTAADFGGNNAAFGDAYESHVFKFLKNKYGDRFKTATELGLVGTRTKDGQIVDRNFADVEGALLDRKGRVMMWFDAKAQSKAGQLAYSRTGKGGVADKFFRAEAKNPNLRLNPRRVAAVFRNRLSSGFIPNFAPLNKNILRDMVRLNIANASESTKGSKVLNLSRSVRGSGKRWQELSNKYNNNIPENEIVNAVFASRYQGTGNPFFEKRFMGQNIEDTIQRHQNDVPDFSGGEAFKKSPFVSASSSKSSAFAHASITGGKIVKQQNFKLSRILNKQAYSSLVDKYGEEKVKETILNLSKLRGGKGIGFDVNDFLKTHYDVIRSKGKIPYRQSENEIAILSKGFIPNLAKIKSKFGKATIGKTDSIDLEFFGKSIGKKINSSQIASIEDLTTVGKGNAGALYSDIASSIKGKGGLFGYALAQNRSVDPKKMKDPLARLKAKYPQIAQRIGLGGETYISGDYGQTVIKASSLKDLEVNQDKILKMVDPAVLTLKAFSKGFVPNFASVFNPVKHIKQGGFIGRANKPTVSGLQKVLNEAGISINEKDVTRANLKNLLSSKENKLKIYKLLKKFPLLVGQYPELYNEIKDGNHRFELAQIAGIKNIPSTFSSKGFIPNFNASLNDAVNREMDAGYSKSQIRIGKSTSLATGLNPEGYGVYNSTEGSLQRGMSLAQKAGIDPKTKGMSAGHIPNFATVNAGNVFGATGGFGSLTGQEQSKFIELNKALSKLAKDTTLTAQDQNNLRNKIQLLAKSLDGTTGSTNIISETNNALNKSLQQNQKAQKKQAVQSQGVYTPQALAAQRAARPVSLPRVSTTGGVAGGGAAGDMAGGSLIRGFLVNQLLSTGAQFAPEEYQNPIQKIGSAYASFETIKALSGTARSSLNDYLQRRNPASNLPPGFGPRRIGGIRGALGRGLTGAARFGAGALGAIGAAAGPLAAAYTIGGLGQEGFDYFGFGGTGTRDQNRELKNLEKELDKFKTESGKALAEYLTKSRSTSGAFGEATGEKVQTGFGGFLGSMGFGATENLMKFDFAEQRKQAAAALAEQFGGIENIRNLSKTTGGGADFASKLFSTLQAAGKETGGLTFDKERYKLLQQQATAGKALNEEETKLLETYKAAKDAAGQLQKNLAMLDKAKEISKIFQNVASSMATAGAKATAMLRIYKSVQEQEAKRGELLMKNYGGGVEGFMAPEKSLESMTQIENALKTLNDPRLRGNAVERGRAASRFMEGATALGINVPEAQRAQLSQIIETGLTTFNERLLNTVGTIGGKYGSNFGIQQGIGRSRLAENALTAETGLNTAQRQLTGSQMAESGYLAPLQMKALMMNDATVKSLQDTSASIQESINRLAGLAEAAAKNQIPIEQFNQAAAALQAVAQNQTPQANLAEELKNIFNTLPEKLRATAEVSANKVNVESTVTGNVQLELTGEAKSLLKQVNELIAIRENKNFKGEDKPTRANR
jgi:TP901 family phage tail tape measure protein